jgi:hypothetical protein
VINADFLRQIFAAIYRKYNFITKYSKSPYYFAEIWRIMRLFFKALSDILLIILKYNIKFFLNLWKKRKRYDIITLNYNKIPKNYFPHPRGAEIYIAYPERWDLP